MHVPAGNDWVVAFAAAARIGALAMPFSTLYAPAELRHALRIGDIHLLIAPSVMFGRDHAEFLERAIPGLESMWRRTALPSNRSLLAVDHAAG